MFASFRLKRLNMNKLVIDRFVKGESNCLALKNNGDILNLKIYYFYEESLSLISQRHL